MFSIKAIYMPDLALDWKKEGSLLFKYNRRTKKFHMEEDSDYYYDLDEMVSDDWLFFKCKLDSYVDQFKERIDIGDAKIITADEVKKLVEYKLKN